MRKKQKKVSAISQIPSGKDIPWEHPDVIYFAAGIVSEYGAILEKTSTVPIGISENLLPYSKREIEEAVEILLHFLKSGASWNDLEQKYPHLGDLIITNDYFKSLRIGYIDLAKFIPEKDAELCRKATKLFQKPENKGKVSGELLHDITSPWFEEVAKISERIASDSLERYALLKEKYGEEDVIFNEC